MVLIAHLPGSYAGASVVPARNKGSFDATSHPFSLPLCQ